jgi:hypothetical protein
MVPQLPMDSNDSMLVLFGGIVASSIVLDVDGTVAALDNAWCIIGSSHSGFPDRRLFGHSIYNQYYLTINYI